MTYERIITVDGVAAIKCLLCDAVSVNVSDVRQKYCGRCHLFHDVVAEGRRMVTTGAGHDCGEWQTFRGVCALCDRVISLTRFG